MFASEKRNSLVASLRLHPAGLRPKSFRAVTRRPAVGMTTVFKRKTRHLRPILIARYRAYGTATVSRGRAFRSVFDNSPDGIYGDRRDSRPRGRNSRSILSSDPCRRPFNSRGEIRRIRVAYVFHGPETVAFRVSAHRFHDVGQNAEKFVVVHDSFYLCRFTRRYSLV